MGARHMEIHIKAFNINRLCYKGARLPNRHVHGNPGIAIKAIAGVTNRQNCVLYKLQE